VVVVIEVDTVESTIPVVSRDFAGVVFEHVDNFAVLSVPLEVWVGLVGYVHTDTVACCEIRHYDVSFIIPEMALLLNPYDQHKNRMSPDIEFRTSFSTRHITNAVLLRDEARKIEATFESEDTSDVPAHESRKHKAYVTNSILSSVAFLETRAKEFVADVIEDYEDDRVRQHYPDLDSTYRNSIANASNIENRSDGASPPIKYNVILDIIGEAQFDRGNDPLEPPALLLNKLRNEMMHYEPEWVEHGEKTYTDNEFGFEKDLRERFELNPIMAPGNPFFPDQCLSASCVA